MSTQQDFTRSFEVNAAMSRGRVVACSPNGKISLAACDDAKSIGVLQVDTTANSYENPKVRLWGAGTAMVAVTGTPLTASDVMVLVTDGYVSVTNGKTGDSGVEIGILLESAAAGTNGQLREVAIQSPRIT
jgi:hypothetical protein